MIKFIKEFLFAVLLVIFVSCSEKEQLNVEEINNRLGTEYMFDWNADSTFVLGIKKLGKNYSNHLSPLEYFVYDVMQDSVLFKESVSGGSVKWISPTQIKINIIPGNISGDEDLTKLSYKYDAVKNRKITNGD